jgi:hypothetical protein
MWKNLNLFFYINPTTYRGQPLLNPNSGWRPTDEAIIPVPGRFIARSPSIAGKKLVAANSLSP